MDATRSARRLLLWDIDGTLLMPGPVASEAFAAAVERVTGTAAADHGVRMGGKTDPLIAREILAAIGLPDEQAERHLPGVLRALEEEMAAGAASLAETSWVLPGVESLLARAAASPGVHQTLLTGNLAANAALKLRALGLEVYLDLDTGAYGSDHHDRDRLVPIAVERVARLRGRTFAPSDIWVLGDTPRDLACARAGGVRCLLVATGRIPFAELQGLGADAVLPDLGDTARAAAILGL